MSEIKTVKLVTENNGEDDDKAPRKKPTRRLESRSLVAFSTSWIHSYRKRPLVIILVGLPTTGKSYLAHKLKTYLNWIGYFAKTYHIKNHLTKTNIIKKYKHACTYFRENYAEAMIPSSDFELFVHEFSLWIQQQAEFIVIDGLNLPRSQREHLAEVLRDKGNRIMYVELILDESELDSHIHSTIIQRNIQKSITEEEYKREIHCLEKDYDTLDPILDDSYIKMYNGGERLETKTIHGCRRTQVLFYISNYKQKLNKMIYLVRSGETINEMYDKVGGDSELSRTGKDFSMELAKYIENESSVPLVWTSSMRSAVQTGLHMLIEQTVWKELDEMNLGVLENLRYNTIRTKYSQDLIDNLSVKFFHRFPGGENYEDLIKRLEPIMMQMEQRHDLVIISHTNIIKCLLGYLRGDTLDQVPDIEVPLHHVIKISLHTVPPKVDFVSLLP